jgi:diaminohydroxyphosphoribosylaminopyrimidine deaminase/5-amino-6-(5-phosphoribosylamino)uracil reductase
MTLALQLAERGRGKTAPNPIVGAVLVKAGRIVGQGYHRRAGAAHAEVAAIKDAAGAAKNATLYVTLEPCCHTGRTGPCTDAIIAAGIKRVVFGAKDPDPRVSGKGAARLRRAGIEVRSGVLRRECERSNEIHFGFHRLGRPFVILKTAQTLDGRVATLSGDSRWITGEKARRLGHRLRSEVDAVAVGMGTVKSDNPSLTTRLFKGRDPYRLILSGSLEFPKRCHVIQNNADGRTIVASTERAIKRFTAMRTPNNLTYWSIKRSPDGLLDLHDLLVQAAGFGFKSLLVEGGSRLATSFLKENLVDKYVVFIAPRVIGDGIDAVGDLAVRRLANAVELEDTSIEQLGGDLLFVGYPKRGDK